MHLVKRFDPSPVFRATHVFFHGCVVVLVCSSIGIGRMIYHSRFAIPLSLSTSQRHSERLPGFHSRKIWVEQIHSPEMIEGQWSICPATIKSGQECIQHASFLSLRLKCVSIALQVQTNGHVRSFHDLWLRRLRIPARVMWIRLDKVVCHSPRPSSLLSPRDLFSEASWSNRHLPF